MSDPYALWRAADGTSKQKSLRIFWPELADALGGTAATADNDPAPDQPKCGKCSARWARGVLKSGCPVCADCFARLPDVQRIGARHRDDWPKRGAVR